MTLQVSHALWGNVAFLSCEGDVTLCDWRTRKSLREHVLLCKLPGVIFPQVACRAIAARTAWSSHFEIDAPLPKHNSGQVKGAKLHAEIPEGIIVSDVKNELPIHRRSVCVWDTRGTARKSDRSNAERVRNKLEFVNVVGRAHIRSRPAVATVLEVVPAYPTVLVAWAATTCLVKDERHEAVFGTIR